MVKIKNEIIAILIGCFICLSVGCASKTQETIKYVQTPIYVEVPIIEKPKIKPIKRPVLEISKINENALPADIAEAYYNSLQQVIKYSQLLEKALNPFYEEYINERIAATKQ